MFPGSVVLVTRRRLRKIGTVCATSAPAESFSCLFASRAASKSREIDSTSSAGDSIPRKSRFQTAASRRRLFAALHDVFKSREISGFPLSFAGFFVLIGRSSAVRRPSRPAPARDVSSTDSIIGRNRSRRIRRPRHRFDARERGGAYEVLAATPTVVIGHQLGLSKNNKQKQRLTEKSRSQTRVICATPFGKGAESGRSKWFLCCVCRSPR
jgi:hypothetical protein